MSILNDRELMTYALRESLSREKHSLEKMKFYYKSTRDNNIKSICENLANVCKVRIDILQKEMKNFYLK
ncbi:MAG: hypothetical protein ACOY31_01090 [Bacillota bacterium]